MTPVGDRFATASVDGSAVVDLADLRAALDLLEDVDGNVPRRALLTVLNAHRRGQDFLKKPAKDVSIFSSRHPSSWVRCK